MQELKIIGRIDLPEKKIRPEDFKELLEAKMLNIQTEVNKEFSCNFLDKKASIVMAENAKLEADQQSVVEIEQRWAQEQYKTLAEWRWSKDKNPATITEMAVTLVLHKLLGVRFVVARASTLDDYKHGIDHVLIDKETGAVVCGFDEILGFQGDDGGDKKSEKIKKIILEGGTSLEYGATIVNGKIKRQKLENIPTFFLSLSKEELIKLLVDLKATELVTENEKKLVSKMLISLDEQYEKAQNIAVNKSLRENLEKFSHSLEIIKQRIFETASF